MVQRPKEALPAELPCFRGFFQLLPVICFRHPKVPGWDGGVMEEAIRLLLQDSNLTFSTKFLDTVGLIYSIFLVYIKNKTG